MSDNLCFQQKLERVRNDFQKMEHDREYIVACGKILTSSEEVVSKLNRTPEANTFNVIRETLFMRMIIELRKIFEKSSKDKKCNLDFMINFIANYKDEFTQYHYDHSYNQYNPSVYISEVLADGSINNRVEKNVDDSLRIQVAEESKQKFAQLMDNLVQQWTAFFTIDNLRILMDNRNFVSHSFSSFYELKEGFTPDDISKLLEIAKDFITKVDIILNRSNYVYESENELWEDASKRFWSRIS